MGKKFLLCLFTVAICCQIVGCSNKTENENEKQKEEVENVSMAIKEGTLTKTGATIIITDKSNIRYVYGEEFRIDRKENDNWTELIGTPNFNEPAYYVNSNGILELEQDWSGIYGDLKKGEYRLVKSIFPDLDKSITEDDKLYIFVEFVIE